MLVLHFSGILRKKEVPLFFQLPSLFESNFFSLNIFTQKNNKYWCQLLKVSVFSIGSDPQEEVLQPSCSAENSSDVIDNIPGIRGQVLNSLDRPSLERFRVSHFGPRIPVKLTGKQNWIFECCCACSECIEIGKRRGHLNLFIVMRCECERILPAKLCA
jgi:hypothetical protein